MFRKSTSKKKKNKRIRIEVLNRGKQQRKKDEVDIYCFGDLFG